MGGACVHDVETKVRHAGLFSETDRRHMRAALLIVDGDGTTHAVLDRRRGGHGGGVPLLGFCGNVATIPRDKGDELRRALAAGASIEVTFSVAPGSDERWDTAATCERFPCLLVWRLAAGLLAVAVAMVSTHEARAIPPRVMVRVKRNYFQR